MIQVTWLVCYKNFTKMSEMTDPDARPRVKNNDISVPACSASVVFTNLKLEKKKIK